MSKSFLNYSRAQGNDLIRPIPEFDFPGLKPGDHWCLCASRWLQAYEDGMAPLVMLKSTGMSSLETIDIELLIQHSYEEKGNQERTIS